MAVIEKDIEKMKTVLMTVPAHFDGAQIQLDVGVELKPDTRLLVTILGEEPAHEMLVWNAMKLSEAAFARVWDNEEDAVYDSL
jgi:hypothetical protein